MDAVLQSLLSGLPVFAVHFATAILVLIAGIAIYVRITPHHEFQLIKQGNVAAAVSAAAATIGLALPLGFCLAGSVNVYDIVLWGGVILAIQLAAYFIVDWLLKGISRSIEEGKLAPVIFLAAIKLSVAILNAAAIAE